jgi:hypothetical protein
MLAGHLALYPDGAVFGQMVQTLLLKINNRATHRSHREED